MGHYRMKKKQQFEMSQREIEQEEKKKLAAIVAEKQAWEKWDNSTPRVMQKTVKELEEMEKDLDREFVASQQVQPQQLQTKPKEQRRRASLANLSLEDIMA